MADYELYYSKCGKICCYLPPGLDKNIVADQLTKAIQNPYVFNTIKDGSKKVYLNQKDGIWDIEFGAKIEVVGV